MDSPSIIPTHPSYAQSVHPPVTPSMTRQSATPPISPETCLSDHPPTSHRLYDTPTSPSDHLPTSHHLYNTPISPSACLSPPDCLTATTPRPPVRPSSPTIHSTQDSNHSLAVMNGEPSHMIHHTQDSSQSLAVMNGSNPARPRNSIGPILTTTYFYMP